MNSSAKTILIMMNVSGNISATLTNSVKLKLETVSYCINK